MYKFIFLLLLISFKGFSQAKTTKKQLGTWEKSVVNLQCEGYVYPKYLIDSVLQSYTAKKTPKKQLDSISSILYQTRSFTGSAIYVKDGSKRYLITAKHVLLDKALGLQKIYENKTGIANWSNNLESIYSAILIRTPLDYNLRSQKFNDKYVTNDNFNIKPNDRPYIFIPDSTGDDIAIVSLQEKNYNGLDKILQEDGYQPISVDLISTSPKIEVGDEVFTVGFPESISVTGITSPIKNDNLRIELVSPFTTFGRVAMNNNAFNSFYVDITIIYGNSGGPVILDNKLIGIISGINLYQISTDQQVNVLQGHLQGIGHFVKIIKMNNVMKYLRMLQEQEKTWQ